MREIQSKVYDWRFSVFQTGQQCKITTVGKARDIYPVQNLLENNLGTIAIMHDHIFKYNEECVLRLRKGARLCLWC